MPWMTLGAVAIAALFSLVFSTLTYALRDFTRSRLADSLEKAGKGEWLEKTVKRQSELIFVTAVARLIANILILVGTLHFLEHYQLAYWAKYLIAICSTGIITLISSVAIPHALAEYAGERIIAGLVQFLHGVRFVLLPATKIMHWVDSAVASAAGAVGPDATSQAEQQIQEEILSVVEEGEKEGIVDEQEREMIESVITFRETSVGQVMTARPDMIGLPVTATLDHTKQILDESGHSRIPVYNGSLDQIVGVLYARDLLKLLGSTIETFDVRTVMRPAFYVPETKLLRELLQDFRIQKVHLAIVLDEYGGTAGLVSIEDVLEELVGDISDEHEPHEPSLIKRIDPQTFEVDARIRLDSLNRALGISLPEDAGYETLGGFVSNTLGRIPQTGLTFEHSGMKITILEAEPQRVNRVKIELVPEAPDEPQANPAVA